MNAPKIKIEIWSDIACPFCYIGKEHLSLALQMFDYKNYVEIDWRSFILDPTLPEKTSMGLFESLSDSKGMPMQQVMDMTAYVRSMGSEAGLDLQFHKVVPVSTRKAHLLLQKAKSEGKGSQMKERLFQAYFTEGLDLCKEEVLCRVGKDLGLSDEETLSGLNSPEQVSALEHDLDAARQMNIRGVPFFVFNGKYAVSGAQPVHVFNDALANAYNEWLQELPESDKVYLEGAVCRPAGKCD